MKQRIRQGKEIQVGHREGGGLICSLPAEKVDSPLSYLVLSACKLREPGNRKQWQCIVAVYVVPYNYIMIICK